MININDIDKIIKNNIPCIYDMKIKSVPEFLYALSKKLNEVIDNVEYIKQEGLEIKIIEKLNIWLNDGTIANLINTTIFKDLNTKIDKNYNDLNSSLETITIEKADKTTTQNIQTQINDLVLGAVGDGNNAEVIQARNGFSVINDRLNIDIPSNVINLNKSYGYINLSGTLVGTTATTYQCSQLIVLKKNIRYIIQAEAWSGVSILSEFTENGEYLRTLITGEEKEYVVTYEFIPSQDMFVKVSGKTDKITLRQHKNFLTVDDYRNNSINTDLLSNIFKANKGFYYTTGTWGTSANTTYRTSDIITIKKGQTVKMSYQLYTGVSAISEWKNGVFVKSLFEGDEAETLKNIIFTPDVDTDIKITVNNKFKNSVELIDRFVLASEIKEEQLNSKTFKWGVIGDSLTEKNLRTTMNYHDYIKDELDCNIINVAKSGMGYNTNGFINQINNLPTDLDVVTIFGSGNDMPEYRSIPIGEVTDNGTTLCGWINKTLDTYFSKFPTTPIGLITPTPWVDFPPSNTTNNMEIYSQKMVEICKRRSIPCLDLYHCSNLRPWDSTFRTLAYSKDDGNGVHPDEVGHEIIYPKIREFIKSLI